MMNSICGYCFKPKSEDAGFRNKLTKAMWAKVNWYRNQKDLNTTLGNTIFCDTCLHAIVTDDTEYLNAVELKRKLLT